MTARPTDDTVVPTADALAWHRDLLAAERHPVAAAIVAATAENLRDLEGLLPETTRFGDLISLRVMAAIHRLALAGSAPAVARYLPTLGGTGPQSAGHRRQFSRAVVRALMTNPDALRSSLSRTPQTNEPGRAALLRCALSRLGTALPVRLREIGASAGLNLRADLLPGVAALEAGPLPVVLDRRGCDRAPIDPTSTEGRLTLSSYVWVDDADRFRQLQAAIAVAESTPAELVTQEADEFVGQLELVDDTITVLWHSAFWVYQSQAQRAQIGGRIDELGRRSAAHRRLVHASWELASDRSTGAEFALVVRIWAGARGGGKPETLAVGRSHGTDVRLLA